MARRINLEDLVRDRITLLEGVVNGITLWRQGCDHVGIKPQGLDKDGKPKDLFWFDEPDVELVEAGKYPPAETSPVTKQRTGGPAPSGRL